MTKLQSLLKRAEEPVPHEWIDRMVCIALMVWTFGEIVFTHSLVGDLDVVRANGLGVLHQALTGGLLIAALTCKKLDVERPTLVVLGCALFSTVVLWRAKGDAGPLVLVLMLVVGGSVDLRLLARCYALSAVVGMLVAMLCSCLGISGALDALVGAVFVPTFGFKEQGVFGYLILSTSVGIALGTANARLRLALAAVDIVGAGLLFVFVRAKIVALFVAALSGGIVLCERVPRLRWLNGVHRKLCWGVALVPLALFCLSNDAPEFLSLSMFQGSYGSLVGMYGYTVLLCLYLCYVCGVLRCSCAHYDYLMLYACLLFAFLLTRGTLPMELEFNCTLLVLTRALSGHAIWCVPAEGRDGVHASEA